MTRAVGRFAALTLAIALAGASCGTSSGGGTTATSRVNPDECGLSAFAAAKKPVDIVMWHTMVRSNTDWLVSATKQFNDSQSDVHVTLVNQVDYQDEFNKYRAGLSSGDLPDLVQLEETTMQQVLDSQSTVPVQACIDATGYDTRDFLPRALAYYAYGGVQEGMPWAVSNPVLMFDPGKFRKAGLDPTKPPQTLAEVKQYSQKIVASGAAKHGISLRVEPYVFEFLLAKSGGEYVNNGNGRQARATESNLTSPQARQIFAWWDDMVSSGLALDTGSALNNIDHLVAIATGDAAMTMEASGVIGPIRAALASGQYPGVTIETAPLPALTTGGGVPVGDASLWIPRHSSPEKRAAAWKFVEFLDSPRELAAVAQVGGYVPIRQTAATDPTLVDFWTQQPWFRTGYDQLVSGPLNDSDVGSLIGNYQGVRDAVRDGITAMLHSGLSPDAAAQAAKRQADAAIQEYNRRAGR